MHRLILPALLALLLVACGGDEPQDSSTPATEAQAPMGQTQAPVTEADVTESVPPAPIAAEPEAQAQEQAAAAPAPQASTAKDWQYAAGKHFSQLTAAQGTAGGPGGIEVIEIFWYGCPHCFSFDPVINGWEKELPADVSFVRLPVMWNPTNEIHARMYYTAEALGKLDEMHTAFFNALHRDGLSLTRENDIRKFFVQNGISEADFDKAFRSFSVESKLKRARDLTQRYRIRSVPVIVVDGKYVVDGPEIKSFNDMLSVTDELVERERSTL
jgi:thiol:disulfide interchange protein DsbA